MKRVGIREFKDQANALLNAEEQLVITRHGQAIGTYIPFKRADKAAAARAAEKLEATLNAIYAKTGMTEDEFMAIFLDDAPSDKRWISSLTRVDLWVHHCGRAGDNSCAIQP